MTNPFKGFLTKETLKQFFFYHIRWQSGFFVVYPTMQFGLHALGLPFWAALMFSSMCGACIFFFIDRLIFGVNEK
jgi:hypothetical protein